MSVTQDPELPNNFTLGPGKNDDTVIALNITAVVVCIAISVLNICCLVVLSKEKKLKEKRFEMLTVCLSISDVAIGLLKAGTSFREIYLRLTGNTLPKFCYITFALFISTIHFSSLQTLWICIERYIATLPTVKNPLRKVSVIGVSFGLYFSCIVLQVALFVSYGSFWTNSCSTQGIFGNNSMKIININMALKMIINLSSVVTYAAVLIRIHSSWRRIKPQQGIMVNKQSNLAPSQTVSTVQSDFVSNNRETGCTNSSETPQVTLVRRKHHKVVRMAITLGLLIAIMLVSHLPKIFLGFSLMEGPMTTEKKTAKIVTELIVLLNPLLDPVVYVLRLQSFRERLKCRNG